MPWKIKEGIALGDINLKGREDLFVSIYEDCILLIALYDHWMLMHNKTIEK